MKKSVMILVLTLAMSIGLVGCAAKNTPNESHSPSASVSPYVTPSTTPHTDVLPDTTLPNDAYEGGSAGGTNNPNGVYDDHNNGTVNDGTVNNGTNHGNGVIGDVIDDVGDAINGENSRTRTTVYGVAFGE